MSHLETENIYCPYCATPIGIVVDCSVKYQEYVEDCEICCRPILLRVSVDDEFGIDIQSCPENE